MEIPDEQRARLLNLAARRGEKGFSHLIQEAIANYLEEIERRESLVEDALSVIGTLDEEAADELEVAVRRIREFWR